MVNIFLKIMHGFVGVFGQKFESYMMMFVNDPKSGTFTKMS